MDFETLRAISYATHVLLALVMFWKGMEWIVDTAEAQIPEEYRS